MAKKKATTVNIVTAPAGRRRKYSRKRTYWGKRSLHDKLYAMTALPDDDPWRKSRMMMFGPNNRLGQAGTMNPDQRAMRRATQYWGPGDYHSFMKGGFFGKNEGMGNAIRGLGSAAGAMIPGGGEWGSGMGRHLAGEASKWLGFGGYGTQGEPQTNQIMGGDSGPISVNSSGDETGDIFINHREFLTNIIASGPAGGSSPFQLTSYAINAGLSQTFPWLAQVAQNFTMYELQGCIFEFKPTSGEFGANGIALGKVIMATQYDPDAPSFNNSIEMENYDYATAFKPSVPQLHGVETASSQRATNMMYIRTGPSIKDKIFTDIGDFQIATEGIPIGAATTTLNIGELWVTYKVKLSRARIFGSYVGQNIPVDTFSNNTQINSGTLASVWNPATQVIPRDSFGNSLNAGLWTVAANTTLSTGSTNVYDITLDQSINLGLYTILAYYNTSNAADLPVTASISAITNATMVAQKSNAALATSTNLAANRLATEAALICQAYVQIASPPGSTSLVRLQLNTAGSAAYLKIIIQQVPYALRTTLATT